MKKFLVIIVLIFLTACATGTYTSRDGDNSNLNQDTLYCKSCKQKRRTISYRHSKRRQRSLDVQKVAL